MKTDINVGIQWSPEAIRWNDGLGCGYSLVTVQYSSNIQNGSLAGIRARS
jgi:hypothetical protein